MFELIFMIVPILVILIFILTFALFLSPKLRGKFLSNQIKSIKYAVDDSKEDLKTISNISADVSSEAITKTVSSIKKGFTDNSFKDNTYCKYCGTGIDFDSRFCKNCGKKI